MASAVVAPDHSAEIERVRVALTYIPGDDRDLWRRIGLSVKAGLGEDGFGLWDAWSRTSGRYEEAVALRTWRSIKPAGRIGLGTLFFEAKRFGYVAGQPECSARVQLAPPSPLAPAKPLPLQTILAQREGDYIPQLPFSGAKID